MAKCLVTGGAGFIGSAILWKLNTEGIDDILVVDDLGSSEKWKNLVNRRYTDYIHKSTFLPMLQDGKFAKIDAIIHMGACSSTTERNADNRGMSGKRQRYGNKHSAQH